jgi:hypothetical protein
LARNQTISFEREQESQEERQLNKICSGSNISGGDVINTMSNEKLEQNSLKTRQYILEPEE